MSLSKFCPSSLKIEYLFLAYDLIDKRQKKVCLDFLVYSMEEEKYLCKFNKTGTQVMIYTRIPSILTSMRRFMAARNGQLTNNTSKVIAFQNLAEDIEGIFDEDAKTNGCFGPPQIVNLPYACNTNIPIKHKLQAFESKWVIDDSEDSRVGDMQYHMVLSIELESKEKPVCRVNKKGMRIFKSP